MPRCGWVFVDHTKNGKRRWCDPEECDTVDKMQRYHAKRKTIKSKKIKLFTPDKFHKLNQSTIKL